MSTGFSSVTVETSAISSFSSGILFLTTGFSVFTGVSTSSLIFGFFVSIFSFSLVFDFDVSDFCGFISIWFTNLKVFSSLSNLPLLISLSISSDSLIILSTFGSNGLISKSFSFKFDLDLIFSLAFLIYCFNTLLIFDNCKVLSLFCWYISFWFSCNYLVVWLGLVVLILLLVLFQLF